MARDIYLDAFERELLHWPGVEHEIGTRAKHRELVVRYRQRSRFHVFPTSGSDSRGHLNSLSDLRRTLRELGAARVTTPFAQKKEQKMESMIQFSPRIHVLAELEQAKGTPLTCREIATRLKADYKPDMSDESLNQTVVSTLHQLKAQGKIVQGDKVADMLTWRYVEPKVTSPINPIMAEKLKPVIAAAKPQAKAQGLPITHIIANVMATAEQPLTALEVTTQVAKQVPGKSVKQLAPNVSEWLSRKVRQGLMSKIDNPRGFALYQLAPAKPPKAEKAELKSYVNPDSDKVRVAPTGAKVPEVSIAALEDAIRLVNRYKRTAGTGFVLSVNDAGLLVGSIQLGGE